MTNFDRIQKMNEMEMAKALSKVIDCNWCPEKDLCDSGHNSGCTSALFDWLTENIGTPFEEIGYGQKFRVNPKDVDIYIKIDEIIDYNCGGVLWNAVNLKTGILINFSNDKLVFVEKIAGIDD